MKKYKFITIEASVRSDGYDICNTKENNEIGWIDYHPHWKCYVLSPKRYSVWSASCLKDVISFIENEIPRVIP